MKNSENSFLRLFHTVIALFFPEKAKEKIIIDSSRMKKRESGSHVHFLYVLLFICGISASLWQHGNAHFTLAALFAVIPFSLFLFIPYRFMDTVTRQLISAGIFFGACFYATYRVKKQIPFDLALVESLIICSFAFLTSCTKKDYRYLFFISLFLLIYGGLVPRKIMLYLIPFSFLLILIILIWEREENIAGENKIANQKDHTYIQDFFRTWHIRFLHILLAIPVFLYIFSLVPLYETGREGLFEVSFMTERSSILPPDLGKWLKQNKKFTSSPEGEKIMKEGTPDTLGKEGAKTKTPSKESSADGDGKGGASPGKDLLFSAVLPAKLYHVGAMYDIYDGTKWQTSPKLKDSRIRERHLADYYRIFSITGKYTVHKWSSRVLYAPFRLSEIDLYSKVQNFAGLTKSRQNFIHPVYTSYSAMISEKNKFPSLPFQYTTVSTLTIPLSNEEKEEKKKNKDGEKSRFLTVKAYASAEELLAENLVPEEVRKKVQKEHPSSVKKKKDQKTPVPATTRRRPILLRFEPAIPVKARTVEQVPSLRKSAKVLDKDPYRLQKAKITVMEMSPYAAPQKFISRQKDRAWQETIPKEHFLQLPPDLSTRIAGLAGIITKDAVTPYQKALALRDYLRNNYKYKLYSEKTPEGKESVDYFLFELKEGHCEYFAAALTILARTAGLPARVVTGFSPGNFNALTKQFDVYEYHAHAWSQIYITHIGWLTFDAVPPTEIVSETTPAGLGLLRDPFGDEWKITPPELTAATLGYIRSTLLKEALENKSKELGNTVSKMLKNDQDLKEKGKKKKGKKGALAKNKVKKHLSARPGIRERLQNFFRYYAGKSAERFFSLLFSKKSLGITVVLVIFAVGSFLLCRILIQWGRTLFLRRKFGILIHCIKTEKDTEKNILSLYRALRLLLLFASMERKNNQELLAYAADTEKMFLDAWEKSVPSTTEEEWKNIRKKALRLSGNIRRIFSAFYSLEYGHFSGTQQDAELLYNDLKEIFLLLKGLYPDGFFFPEKLFFSDPFSG